MINQGRKNQGGITQGTSPLFLGKWGTSHVCAPFPDFQPDSLNCLDAPLQKQDVEVSQRKLGSEITEKDCQTQQYASKVLWTVGNGES